jgi:LacI family transcriptional regulator
MTKKTTVYDIAHELGLSPSTVSRVLNNSSLISHEKSELIISTAERMGYRKRSIKRQKNRVIVTIRLMMPPAKYSYIHLFYDVSELIEGIQKGFNDTKVNIIISINDGDLTLFDSKKLGDIDGCIFAFTRPSLSLEAMLAEREIPFILLNREDKKNNYVMIDGLGGMQKLVNVMWDRYGKDLHPCYIGFSPLDAVSKRREEGVRLGCASLSIPFSDKDVFNIDAINELKDTVLPQILERSYNAVLCFNDLLAFSLYQSALNLSLAIPDSFSLSGFDNSPMLDLLDKRINTIEFSLRKLGVEAGLWLQHKIIERIDLPLQKNLEGTYIGGGTI